MMDMLFVSSAHTLSPYIFSLDDRHKQLSGEERISIKEPLDPGARFVSHSIFEIEYSLFPHLIFNALHCSVF